MFQCALETQLLLVVPPANSTLAGTGKLETRRHLSSEQVQRGAEREAVRKLPPPRPFCAFEQRTPPPLYRERSMQPPRGAFGVLQRRSPGAGLGSPGPIIPAAGEEGVWHLATFRVGPELFFGRVGGCLLMSLGIIVRDVSKFSVLFLNFWEGHKARLSGI